MLILGKCILPAQKRFQGAAVCQTPRHESFKRDREQAHEDTGLPTEKVRPRVTPVLGENGDSATDIWHVSRLWTLVLWLGCQTSEQKVEGSILS